MEPAAPADNSFPALSRRHRQLANAVLALFCVYVAAIYVLALDQNLHWGLFPNRAEKVISAKIQQLGDTSLTKEQHEALMDEIINWNSFAVPPLLQAIAKDPPAIRDPAVQCLNTLAYKFYYEDTGKYGSDPVKLNQWWTNLQAKWAKAENEKKP